MVYDYFGVISAHAGFFLVILHDGNVQEFETRWDEVLLRCQKFYPIISWKVCKK